MEDADTRRRRVGADPAVTTREGLDLTFGAKTNRKDLIVLPSDCSRIGSQRSVGALERSRGVNFAVPI